ncbi:MAG TPA: neutral/alkaline non-lysosomal ceramidase N-terminal domain-containing protein [Blastocatellia bacterium]|nr:neutral/alkaline non-lysosomal ceramidase N-terminal domain-containing protein [Blastocatellia bacterium]HMV82451.1 neutral/alkaline non-lysosomal ceramidase N-terminal domain-containing protein [Blastocatellia bacterium]HMY73405.1 neutral/alkaline non-lysosomal ceramidase N-terminal domain-containing protein [Blastocatellia bacterium]HMZ20140.1 neutral/alkaline non-lysosomal ceramidase N-terminal domain-containing protein [Blastocatellia bacterium]HNG31130.1 neutral/alkaline non-lysosomal c
MSICLRLCLLALSLTMAVFLPQSSRPQAASVPAGFKAGLARVSITPEKPVWMAGYAARNKPLEGKLHELWAKALAVQDSQGNRVVIITTDLLGLPGALTSEISEHANKSYRLRRDQILFNSSHTHSGPVLTSSLAGAYALDTEQTKAVNDYTYQLKGKLINLIGDALKDLSPAKLSFGRGAAQFAVNRREKKPDGTIVGGVNREGPVDREVPVLKVESANGKLRGVLFGYACHNTTLTGGFYEISGDYAGFAQLEIEKTHTGTTALFLEGCGADVNPYPRSKLELAEQHGKELANSVDQVLADAMSPVNGQTKSVLGGVKIAFAPTPNKEEWQSRLKDPNDFRRRHAERWLAKLERDGKIMSEYPYTVQILQIGELKLVALAGEVVTDYSLRLKKELGGNTWVAGYSNDLCSYIPSARMYAEGGYEVVESMIYYDLPGPYTPAIEETITGKVHELNQQLTKKK